MKILVDTSIWSLALRRIGTQSHNDQFLVQELSELINDLRVVITGPIRQELLSGITSNTQFNILKEKLQAFVDVPVKTNHYEKAADFFNICRRKGVQGSHIDFLICSIASINNFEIFTTDKDFLLYANHIPISLYHPEKHRE